MTQGATRGKAEAQGPNETGDEHNKERTWELPTTKSNLHTKRDSKYRFTSCVSTRGFTGDHDLSKSADRCAKESTHLRNMHSQKPDTGISVCNQSGDSGVPAVETHSL